MFRVVAGFDPEDPYARPPDDPCRRPPAPVGGRFRIGVPPGTQLEFFGDADAARLFSAAAERLASLGGEAVEVDFTPFDSAARLLYEGPWVAERVAAIRSFFERQPDALLPVTRMIFDTALGWNAVRTFEAMYALQSCRRLAAAQWERMEALLLPTAGTIYTIEQVEADPIRLNSQLGRYTNFVNLLDLAAVAVPAGFRPDGLPFGVSLIGPAGTDSQLLTVAEQLHQPIPGKPRTSARPEGNH